MKQQCDSAAPMDGTQKGSAWREFNVHDDDDEVDTSNTAFVARLFDTTEEDPYAVLEIHNIALRGRSECNQSTGVALWKGSEILCDYLVKYEKLVQGKRVLELGAGLGLCGIAAHHLGASQVFLTDGDCEVLQNLRFNVEQNKRESGAGWMGCSQLIWGRELDDVVRLLGRQDVILGADVVYVTKSLEPLWQTVDKLLDDEGIFIFVGACASQASLEEVLKMAARFGFAWCCAEDATPVLFYRRKTIASEDDKGSSSCSYYVENDERKEWLLQ